MKDKKKPAKPKQPKKREPFKAEIISENGFFGIKISLDEIFFLSNNDKDN